MNKLPLKYGCNPNQAPSSLYMEGGGNLPFVVLSGTPGYINFLDALNAWQLVSELKLAVSNLPFYAGGGSPPCATSFKHVSPTSAALGLPLSEGLARACFVDDVADLHTSPLAMAYARARGADRLCSYGDFIALSDECDAVTARLIMREVSDGVIAPAYSPEALELLKSKRNGKYNVIQIDPDYVPAEVETKQVFGVSFEQRRNDAVISAELLKNIVTANKTLPDEAIRDLLVAMITLKYTQSNSVCYAVDGQAIGVGAGQQSRIHCTRLAGDKADVWHLRQHPKTLALPFKEGLKRMVRDNLVDDYVNGREIARWSEFFTAEPVPFTLQERQEYLATIAGISLGSDAFFPVDDNIVRASESGVGYIAQPGGSLRDEEVTTACDERGIVMAHTGLRLFSH